MREVGVEFVGNLVSLHLLTTEQMISYFFTSIVHVSVFKYIITEFTNHALLDIRCLRDENKWKIESIYIYA